MLLKYKVNICVCVCVYVCVCMCACVCVCVCSKLPHVSLSQQGLAHLLKKSVATISLFSGYERELPFTSSLSSVTGPGVHGTSN